MDNKKVCCVTGHRPSGFPWDYRSGTSARHSEYLEAMACYLDLYIRKHGFNYFISGGAIGADTDFAETVIGLRDNVYPDIKLEIAAPCRGQDKMWIDADKARYAELLDKADRVVYLSEEYTADCMMKRNKYMVDNSDVVFAFCNRSKKHGGVYNTVEYAKKQGKPLEIFILNDY